MPAKSSSSAASRTRRPELYRRAGSKGLPDGLKVDRQGNVFLGGPGGILVLTPEGKHLGTIVTGQVTANCAFGDDGSTLYITADSCFLRIRLKTVGDPFHHRDTENTEFGKGVRPLASLLSVSSVSLW